MQIHEWSIYFDGSNFLSCLLYELWFLLASSCHCFATYYSCNGCVKQLQEGGGRAGGNYSLPPVPNGEITYSIQLAHSLCYFSGSSPYNIMVMFVFHFKRFFPVFGLLSMPLIPPLTFKFHALSLLKPKRKSPWSLQSQLLITWFNCKFIDCHLSSTFYAEGCQFQSGAFSREYYANPLN